MLYAGRRCKLLARVGPTTTVLYGNGSGNQWRDVIAPSPHYIVRVYMYCPIPQRIMRLSVARAVGQFIPMTLIQLNAPSVVQL